MTPDDRRLEDALRSVGDDYVRRNPADFSAARARVAKLHRRHRLRMGAFATLAGTAVVAAVLAWPAPERAREGLQPAGPRVTSQVTIEVGDQPSELAAGDDAIWVSNAGDASVSRIDPSSNRQVAEVSVMGRPGDLAVAGDDAVWVANPELGAVQRIDAASNARTPDMLIPVAPEMSELDLAIDKYLWVSVVGVELVQIDPSNGEIVRRVTDVTPVNVAARTGRVFVLEDDGNVVELDAETGERTGFERTFDITDRGDVHYYGGRLWVAEGDGSSLLSADASDPGAPVSVYEFPGDYMEMVHTPSDVLVLSDSGTGEAILSAVTAAGAETFRGLDLTGSPRDLVQGSASLWISNSATGTVTRLEAVPGALGG